MDHYTDVTGTGVDHVITVSRLMLPSLYPQSDCWQICSLLERNSSRGMAAWRGPWF